MTCCAPDCRIDELFRLLCKARMLDLLHVLVAAPGPVRFVDLVARLRINPNTLSARLKSLVAAGLVTRTAHRETPPRVEYEATQRARTLQPVFDALHAWARAGHAPPVLHA